MKFYNPARPCRYKQAITLSIHRVVSLRHRIRNFRGMWVSFGYKQQNDREPHFGNPTHMNNVEDIVNGIFLMLLNLPSIFATATSNAVEIKNNHTATSILTYQCWKTDSIGTEKLRLIWSLLFLQIFSCSVISRETLAPYAGKNLPQMGK